MRCSSVYAPTFFPLRSLLLPIILSRSNVYVYGHTMPIYIYVLRRLLFPIYSFSIARPASWRQFLLLRRFCMDDYRGKMWVSLAQGALDLLRQDMYLANGGMSDRDAHHVRSRRRRSYRRWNEYAPLFQDIAVLHPVGVPR